jgi:imidazolonepropionase-like amidohydrolase
MKTLPSMLLMLVLAACATPRSLGRTTDSEPSFAIRNARIFDGERVISSGIVLVRGDRIAAVGQDVDLSGVGEIIDGHGQTLLPGLIDSHFHADGPEAYRTALAFGVTTVIDMFGQLSLLTTRTPSLGALATRGRDEADTLVGLLITAPGGHGTQIPGIVLPTVTTPQECQVAVTTQLDAGASFVKLVYDAGEPWSRQAVPTLSRELLASCIEAAHTRGVLVVVHALTLRRSREAIEAGADGLAHGVTDVPPDPAFAALLAARGAFVVPTFAVISGAARQRNAEEILSDPWLEPYLPLSSLGILKTPIPEHFGEGMRPSVTQESIRLLNAAQVPLLAGTDCANPGTAVGATLHQELEMLVSAGLTPTQALAAATSLAAARFRLTDRGHIAPGKRADLLLVRGDPTKDIRMTRDIAAVWKQGRRLDRKAWREHVKAAREEKKP